MKEAKGSTKKGAAKKAQAAQNETTTRKAKARVTVATEPARPSSPNSAAPPAGPHSQGDDRHAQLPVTKGKVGVFGGPKDRGIKPDDKLALPTGPHTVYERIRSLNPNSFYCAMRFDYKIGHTSPEEGKRWWANRKLLVTNPKNEKSAVVRAVDYGPHENTGLDISISPGTAAALEVEVGDEVEIAFADPRAPLGEVS